MNYLTLACCTGGAPCRVPNHMGHQNQCNESGCYPEEEAEELVADFAKFTPFNDSSHYHAFCDWDGNNTNQLGVRYALLLAKHTGRSEWVSRESLCLWL